MAIDENDSFSIYKQKSARIAFDLYGKDVADKIRQAKNEAEICRILTTERHKLP